MALLDLYGQQAGPTSQPLQALPSTPGERWDATMGEALAPDRYFNLNASRRDWYQRTADELHASTGQRLPNPLDPPTHEEMFKDGVAVPTVQIQKNRLDALIQANRELRETKPDAIDAEGIDTFIGLQGQQARDKDASLSGTGNGWASFAAGMAAPTPENMLAFLIPPSRAVLGASTVANGFVRGMVREGLYQGGAMGALTAGTSALDVMARGDTGTAPGPGEIATDIAGATVGGAVLGAGFHGLFHGPKALWEHWQAMPPEVRAKATLEERDAFQTIEREVLYGGQNRIGLPWALHERYQGNALDAIMNRRPVTWDEVHPGDTPMTGLATVLRGAPDRAQVDLPAVMSHFEGLPDSEIESFARQQKPRSFERLDRVSSDLSTLRQQLADEQAKAPSIHDLVDPDTSLRLQAIETDLAKPALTKKARAALEQERESITATVDPRDMLPKKAAREQTARMADLQAKIARLESQHEETRATADSAVKDLRTKLGRYADTVEPKQAAKEAGFKTPDDMAEALQRADFERSIRTMREVMPASSNASAAAPGAGGPARVDIKVNPEADVTGLLKGKTASDARKELLAEIEKHDADVKDIAAILKCAGGAAA